MECSARDLTRNTREINKFQLDGAVAAGGISWRPPWGALLSQMFPTHPPNSIFLRPTVRKSVNFGPICGASSCGTDPHQPTEFHIPTASRSKFNEMSPFRHLSIRHGVCDARFKSFSQHEKAAITRKRWKMDEYCQFNTGSKPGSTYQMVVLLPLGGVT